MSCRTCDHYKRPPRLGLDEILGGKGECRLAQVQGYGRKVNPNESCAFDTTKVKARLESRK